MKLCLIGSTRFKDLFIDANKRLTEAGHVVYTVAFFSHADQQPLADDTKETLDLVHLRKIMESEAVVLITNVNSHAPYIGDSTRRELKWAALLGLMRLNWYSEEDRKHLLWNCPIGWKPQPYTDKELGYDEGIGHGG